MSGWRVPGRIEVLGKHTDYGGGRVLVCAVERAVTVTAEPMPGADGEFLCESTAYPGQVSLKVGEDPSLPPGHWARYVHTVVERLAKNFGELAPAKISVASDLPPASGMSSSSALLTGSMLALADLNGLWERAEWQSQISDRLSLAGYAASIENGKTFGSLAGRPGVGTSGGSLDHTGMLTSDAGMLTFAEFDPMRIISRVRFPEDHVFVIAVSGRLAEKTGDARELYNRGPAALSEILRRWNAGQGRADASLTSVVRHLCGGDRHEALDNVREQCKTLYAYADEGYPAKRLHQFLIESTVLVPSAVQALERGDLEAFSQVVDTSQALAVSHLGNQVPETELLVELARSMGAVTASAFGAGFGGSVWALVPRADAHDFADSWLERYKRTFDLPAASTIVTAPGDSASRLAS